MLGLAFHPNYKTNRYFFVFYCAVDESNQRYNRLSRFEVNPENPNVALHSSEKILISQKDEGNNHNSGDLHFGPDGYLYVSLGDEGGGYDSFDNAQRINKDFFSGILRLDVDELQENLRPNPHPAVHGNYRVPADNPYVGATSFNNIPVNPEDVRTEFWAVGLRNPWRMSFDPATGRLFAGDVGQGEREEVNIIEKGGNYGWAFREGTIDGPSGRPSGVTSIDPIFEYSRFHGTSIIGGVFYWGNKMPELAGSYITADFAHGHVRALQFKDDGSVVPIYLCNDQQITAFGIDPSNGDVLTADRDEGRIERLVRSSPSGSSPIPSTLSQTGAFADLSTLTPNPGWVPYEINVPFWSDYAIKSRWFTVPNPESQMVFSETGSWGFPVGSAWLKHFEMEMIEGDPESRRRLETRFILRTDTGIYGVTYKWNEDETEAKLVPEEGENEVLEIQTSEGVVRNQLWRYPSRAECMACHDHSAGWALGFHTAQLNREFHYPGGSANQLTALHEAGYFSDSTAPEPNLLPALAKADNKEVSLEFRVRSYLDANCSQCHSPNGLAQGELDARYETPTEFSNLIRGMLNSPELGADVLMIQPGALEHSMLLSRIQTRGAGQMPPMGSNELDPAAIELITEWIETGLADYKTYAEWRVAEFGSENADLSEPTEDADQDGASNLLEYLTHTNPRVAGDAWKISLVLDSGSLTLQIPRLKNRSFQIQYTDDLHALEGAEWKPLNHPVNRPFFSSEDVLESLNLDLDKRPGRVYRALLVAP